MQPRTIPPDWGESAVATRVLTQWLYLGCHYARTTRTRAAPSSNYDTSRYTTGLNPTAYTARTARTVRRPPRITTRVVTPRGWHHDSDSRRGWHHDSDSRRGPTTITTRGRGRPQHANSEQAAGRPRVATRGSRTVLRATSVRLRAVIELRHPVKTARRGGVGTPIDKAGARFW